MDNLDASDEPVRELARLRAEAAALHSELEPWIDAAIRFVVAAFDELEAEQADAMVAELGVRTQHDPVRELAMHRKLAAALRANYEYEPALDHLRAAFDLARGDDRIVVGLELADGLRSEGAGADAVLDELLALAIERAHAGAEHRDRLARVHLAFTHRDWEQHVRAAHALCAASADAELRRSAAEMLAGVLFQRAIGIPEGGRWFDAMRDHDPDRTLLAEAEALLVAHPTENDALLEDVRRRLGTLAHDPPPHELVQPPPPPDVTPDSWTWSLYVPATTIPDELRHFFTPPGDDLAAHLRTHRLPSSEKVREWSYGAVATEADLDSQKIFGPMRSFYCACGRFRGNRYRGVVCHRCGVELIDRVSRATRSGHIALRTPVVHPWFGAAVAALLDISPAAVRTTPAPELRERLDRCYAIEIASRARHAVENARSDKQRRKLSTRAAIADALSSSGAYPRDLVLELVPVLPPEVDWPSVAPAQHASLDRDALRVAYRRLVGGDEPSRAVAALFRCF